MPQRIAVNGRFMHRRPAGVERYARELSTRLEPPARIIGVAFASRPGRPHDVAPAAALGGHLWEQFRLPRQLSHDEILWSPANSGPWSVSLQAVTLHDASPFDHPEWFRPNYGAWARLSWKILARTCRLIFTVSEFSRRRLTWQLRPSGQKLHVIPNGVGRPFGPASKNAIRLARDKYSIEHPYFFFAGTHEPRKNLARLFLAWEQVGGVLGQHELVVAGEPGEVFRNTGYRTVPSRVRLLHYVPDSDLPGLYAGAVAAVLPSLYEGFCLPVLEAMACGTPVITASGSCLPEITGGAALLVDAHESRSIASAMRMLVDDRGLADELRARGLVRAQEFSWDTSAQQLQSILQAA